MLIRARVKQLLLTLIAIAGLSCCHWAHAADDAAVAESAAAAAAPPSAPQCRVSSQLDAARSSAPSSRVPTLLFWDTEGVNYQMYDVWFGPQAYYRCPVECRVKSGRSRSDLAQAEAVLFWATPLDKDIPLESKCPGQLWIQSSTEAFDIHILDRTPPSVSDFLWKPPGAGLCSLTAIVRACAETAVRLTRSFVELVSCLRCVACSSLF